MKSLERGSGVIERPSAPVSREEGRGICTRAPLSKPSTSTRQPLAERRDAAEQYLITASANITDALLVLMGTPFEEEIRSYLMDLYALESRVRG